MALFPVGIIMSWTLNWTLKSTLCELTTKKNFKKL